MPLLNRDRGTYESDLREWAEQALLWVDGYVLTSRVAEDGSIDHDHRRPRTAADGDSFVEWHGPPPSSPGCYMPAFPEGTATHWQMYETCTEGTPISPAFATPEELARWLADTGASSFGGETASYERWLATILPDTPCPSPGPCGFGYFVVSGDGATA